MEKKIEIDELYKNYLAICAGVNIRIDQLCLIGKRLRELSLVEEADHCYRTAVDCMLRFLQKGEIDKALSCESLIYNCFVKTLETEEHYFKCFSDWSNSFRDFSFNLKLPPLALGDKSKICFVVPNGIMLGHTEVMIKTIDDWLESGVSGPRVSVASLSGVTKEFRGELERRAIPLIHFCTDDFKKLPKPAAATLALREVLQKSHVHNIVWVSLPTLASFALSLPLAPRQVFWALKLHPVYFDSTMHVCGGQIDESTRAYNEKKWVVCPFPLTVAMKKNDPVVVNQIRNEYGAGSVVLGCLAREDKFNSSGFLNSLGKILSANPHCVFLYTGRERSNQIESMGQSFGVGAQCRFIGWVDTNLYAQVLDIFLETYPFGCGVTGFQAMGHGTPLLSFASNDTMFGYQLKGGSLMSHLDKNDRESYESLPILTAKDDAHYIDLAQALIDSPQFRKKTGDLEQRFFEDQRKSSHVFSEKFLDIINT